MQQLQTTFPPQSNPLLNAFNQIPLSQFYHSSHPFLTALQQQQPQQQHLNFLNSSPLFPSINFSALSPSLSYAAAAAASYSQQPNPLSLSLLWARQNSLQQARAQLATVQESYQHVKLPEEPLSKGPMQSLPTKPQVQVLPEPVEPTGDNASSRFLPELCDTNKSMKAHLKDIIFYVLNHVGRVGEKEIEVERLKYRNSLELQSIFDIAVEKYTSMTKPKDELLKYSFKKALKFMRQKLRKSGKATYGTNSSGRKTNFRAFLEELAFKVEAATDDQENNAQAAKQNGKNNSITSEIIFEAFSCEEFHAGFQEYLKNLEATVELDNNKKIDKYIKQMEISVKTNTIKDIKKFKRVPWLKIWIESVKKIARELIDNFQTSRRDQNKLLKKEELAPLDQATSDSSDVKCEDT